ncbi:TLC domain-containing protein [Penicillium canescens]|nr:TLC domain-containing protein [Penicillium canescens]
MSESDSDHGVPQDPLAMTTPTMTATPTPMTPDDKPENRKSNIPSRSPVQSHNSKIIIRRVKRKGDSLFKDLVRWFLDNQISTWLPAHEALSLLNRLDIFGGASLREGARAPPSLFPTQRNITHVRLPGHRFMES